MDLRDPAPLCDQCGHANGADGWFVLRRLRVRLRLPVRPIACGDTQWYEDDELRSCRCREPIHSG